MHYLNRYTITYNGEIYNYLEIKNQLLNKGYKFKTDTDTEVILASYDYWGKDCLTHFDGMFAFAIYDNTKNNIFIARDRFGEKPFYYTIKDKTFYFASEMKALWALGINKNPLKQRVYEYLLFSTIENPFNKTQTFYENIFQLQPSHYAIINLNNTTININQYKYWDIDITTTSNLNFIEAKEQFLELFKKSIEKRLRSDVQVGSSLSGGLDSSAIVCTIKHYFGDVITNFNTFSAVFPGFEKDESVYIDEVIAKTGYTSYKITPNPDSFLNNFEKLMYHQEEPFGSSSIAAQFEVMQLAKKHNTTVLLDGQGADEILAGYPGMWATYLKQLYYPFSPHFKKEYKSFTNNIPDFKLNETFGKIFADKYLYNFNKKIGDIRRPFINPKSDFYLGLHAEFVQAYNKTKNPSQAPPNLKKHLKFSLLQRGLNELLRYADRNSMAHSVEVRLPFLNHELVEFLFSLPDNYIISNGWSKKILRESMEGILPEKIQWRKDKIGFEPPQNNWFNDKLMEEKLNHAIKVLQKEKIIDKPNKKLYWNYLMLGEIYG
jgi:asparagine synthase (glutamine-hydrolysing)